MKGFGSEGLRVEVQGFRFKGEGVGLILGLVGLVEGLQGIVA